MLLKEMDLFFKLFSNNNIHISEGFGYCGEKCDVQSNSPK
jgi:hypothetical protein